MKQYSCYIGFLLLLLASCSGSRKIDSASSSADSVIVKKQTPFVENITLLQERFLTGVDFIGSGNEPFWSVEIDLDQRMIFKVLGADSINVPTVPAIRLMDVAASSYRAETTAGLLNIVVYDQVCINDMSGDSLPKRVEVYLGEKKFSGCGQYLVDYRLNDIWVLRSINDTITRTTKKLRREPVLEFNILTSKFYGNTSCNEISGELELKGDHIRMPRINNGKVNCNDNTFDIHYLSILEGREMTYVILEGKLVIRSGNNTLTYQKVD